MGGRRTFISLAAALLAAGASALNVVWDNRTPETHRQWGDSCYLREQMEVVGKKICQALYGKGERSNLHENFTIILYLAPVKGGNPAFASGRRITWKVGPNPHGNPGLGLLCHEMTHILDMGSDGVFTEAMADWTRNYMVNYRGCSNPTYVLDLRYKALRGGRHYGKYVAGAHFIDFMTQNYGDGTIYKILQGYKQHGKNHWEKTFGKNFDGLIAEWRQMETIYDPVFQWTYNGIAAGSVRHDRGICSLGALKADNSSDKSGAWLDGATVGHVNKISNGNMTLALHGWFPNRGHVAIASLGSAAEKSGKAVLLATTPRKDVLAAYVVASIPGKGRVIVSTAAIHVPNLALKPHSVILTTRGGDEAAVVVDGQTSVKVDMNSKCQGCVFTPVFAVGGMSGGIGVKGISESRGKGGVKLDDVRVFNRTFRARETKLYATTFNAAYRGGVAATASWCGPQGSPAVDDIGNWNCVNSLGERVFVLPTQETEVTVCGKALPSIPVGAKFACKSFTIGGLAIADESNIDLRGVKVVDVEDNSRIITRNGHLIAVNVLRAGRIRLDGKLAAVTGMKVSGNLEMRSGSRLRLPINPELAFVKSLSVNGEGPVVLRPGAATRQGRFQKIMLTGEAPRDLTRFRLSADDDEKAATFKGSPSGTYLSVTPHR